MPYLGRELPAGRSRGKNIGPVEQALPFMRKTFRPSYGLQNGEYAHEPAITPKCRLSFKIKKNLLFCYLFSEPLQDCVEGHCHSNYF